MDILYMLSKVDTICRKKGIKKADLYSHTGLTASAVSQWRTGKTTPAKASIESIADYLAVSVYELTGEQKEKPVHDVDELTDTQKEAVEFIKTLSQDQLLRFIKIGEAAFSNESGVDQ